MPLLLVGALSAALAAEPDAPTDAPSPPSDAPSPPGDAPTGSTDTPPLPPDAAAEQAAAAPLPPPPDIDLGGIRGGYGLQPFHGQLLLGPAFGLSYSFQTRHFQLGFQPIEIGWSNAGDDAGAFNVRFLRFEGAYIVSPSAPASLYAGGGIGLSAQFVTWAGADPGGFGFEVPLFVGGEILRHKNIRFTGELEGVLPLYRLQDVNEVSSGWPLVIGLRLGASVKMRRTLADVIGAWIGA